MKLSSRSRHAISAMLELALQDEKGDLPIVDMARKYNISQSSMEQLFARLRANGLVTGRRGRRGGYRLARAPEAISVAEIVASVDDEKMASIKSEETPTATATAAPRRRVADALWASISDQLYDFLNGISLADVLEKRDQVDGGENKSGDGSVRMTEVKNDVPTPRYIS